VLGYPLGIVKSRLKIDAADEVWAMLLSTYTRITF